MAQLAWEPLLSRRELFWYIGHSKRQRAKVVLSKIHGALSDGLREDAIKLFEEYVQLGKVKFTRAPTPPGCIDEPWAIMFSLESEHAYGAVMYLRWNSDQGPIVRRVESKAK